MTQTTLCKYCHGSIKDTDRFCYYCGKTVNTGIQTTNDTQTPTANMPEQTETNATANNATPAQTIPPVAPETTVNSNATPAGSVPPLPAASAAQITLPPQPSQSFSGGTQTQSEALIKNSVTAETDTPAQPDVSPLQSDFSAQINISAPPVQPAPAKPADLPPMPQVNVPPQPAAPAANTPAIPSQPLPVQPENGVTFAASAQQPSQQHLAGQPFAPQNNPAAQMPAPQQSAPSFINESTKQAPAAQPNPAAEQGSVFTGGVPQPESMPKPPPMPAAEPNPPWWALQNMSMEPDGSIISGTQEPEALEPEKKLEMEPKKSAPIQNNIPFQATEDAPAPVKEEPLLPKSAAVAAETNSTTPSVNSRQKSKKDKVAKTATRLKADPLAKTKMLAKEKASKPKAKKASLPFYFLLPHTCILFSIIMLLLTVVSFYSFNSSVGVLFLFPIWPLGLFLFAVLMFFTPLRDPMAPRSVNFLIKLNLAYNIIMLAVSIAAVLTDHQNINLWGFTWLAGGFILPLLIIFLNRRFMN